MNKQWRWLILALVFLAGVGAAPQPQKSAAYERYDVEIQVQADGSLLVAETYQMRFEGEFQSGFAEIPLDRADDIVEVLVREGGQVYDAGGYGPGAFNVDYEQGSVYVDWEYEPTSGVEVRTFTVEYRVVGGLEIHPDQDVLSWTVVPWDRSGIPVEASRAEVRLPARAESATLLVNSQGTQSALELSNVDVIAFEAPDPIPDGASLEIEVRFPHGLTSAIPPAWQEADSAPETVYRWDGLHTDLTIAPDGALEVMEEHALAVEEGYLYHAYREIPWLYLDQIPSGEVWQGERSLKVSAEPCEYCYVVETYDGGTWVWATSGGEVVIDEDAAGSTLLEWAFPFVVAGDKAAFQLHYTALGAVRVLTDAQEIIWTAVFADRDVEVREASVSVHLPPGVSAADVTVAGGAAALQPDGTIWIAHDGPVPSGETWSPRIRLPAGATMAEKPDWQLQIERAMSEAEAIRETQRQAEVRRARWQLGLGTMGCLLPILGLAGTLLAWYVWGRDRPAPVAAQYLTEPPSDLPPGIVAYLVDERPTVKGVLADLLHLATLGLVSVDLRKPDFTVALNWGEKIKEGESVRVEGGAEVALVEHERTLFNTLLEEIKWTHRDTRFSNIHSFTQALPGIYFEMGELATQYFSVRPDEARRRWSWAGQWVIIVAGVLALLALFGVQSVGPVAFAPPVGLALAGLTLMIASRWMPQRTTLGVEEAARWRAFRRYLQSLKQYWGVEAAQEALDRYFPYAVALDVEEVVLRQAEKMGAQIPVWMVPALVEVSAVTATEVERRLERGERPFDVKTVARRMRRPGGRATEAEPRRVAKVRPSLAERPSGAELSLDGLSSSLSRSLERASNSLSSLLNSAAGETESSPFELAVRGAGKATKMTWKAGTSTMDVLGDILKSSSSGGGGGGYSGKSSRSFRSSSWSSSRSSRRSSSRSSSSSRRSGGGGRRGFG